MTEGDLTITCRECDEDTVVDASSLINNYAKCCNCEEELSPYWYYVELIFALLKRVEILEEAKDG